MNEGDGRAELRGDGSGVAQSGVRRSAEVGRYENAFDVLHGGSFSPCIKASPVPARLAASTDCVGHKPSAEYWLPSRLQASEGASLSTPAAPVRPPKIPPSAAFSAATAPDWSADGQ